MFGVCGEFIELVEGDMGVCEGVGVKEVLFELK